MRRLHLSLALALAVGWGMLAGAGALGQQPGNAAAPQAPAPPEKAAPVSQFTVPDQVTMDMRGLDVDNVLQFFSRTYGLTVIKDPGLTGPVTVMCPRPVSQQEAFDILNSVLAVRGFTAVITGNVMKVVPIAKAVQSSVEMSLERPSAAEGDVVKTQIIRLKSADATQLQAQLTPLITTGASLIADPASNTLTVTDYASNIARLLQIIDQMDSENATLFRVFPLSYAQASDLAPMLTQVFFTQPRTTTMGGMPQAPGFMRRLTGATQAALAARGAAATGPVGQVVAETRTNSLLVSASKERMEAIAEVIRGLDRPVERRGDLTVVPLVRANAADVAAALNQALGVRTTGQAGTASTGVRTTSTSSRTTSAGTTSGIRPTTTTPTRAAALPAETGEASSPIVVAQAEPSAPAAPAAAVMIAPPGADAQSANVIQLGGNVSVVAEPNTNSLIINAPPEYALIVKDLIQQLDQAPPQVLIEAIVAEVALDAERKLGFEFTWTEHPHFGNSDLTGTIGTSFGLAAETTGLTYAIAGKSLDTLLHALTTDNNVTILSTPRIFTSNNRAAEINISTQTPYVSTVITSDDTQTFAVQYLDVGVILQVTPQIAPDGTVTMEVNQEANELLGFESFGTNVRAPTVARRSAQATIRVADGQTVILGGIISDNTSRNVSKVPLLGDLPLVGNLFRHTTTSRKKSELLVFLTPKVVRTPEEAAALTRSEQAKSIVPVPATPTPDLR